jgi:hypothetical protein
MVGDAEGMDQIGAGQFLDEANPSKVHTFQHHYRGRHPAMVLF